MPKRQWQAKKRGKRVETIGRWEATVPICHACRQKHLFINLSVRDWYCQSCEMHHDRDVNQNIYNITEAALKKKLTEDHKYADAR